MVFLDVEVRNLLSVRVRVRLGNEDVRLGLYAARVLGRESGTEARVIAVADYEMTELLTCFRRFGHTTMVAKATEIFSVNFSATTGHLSPFSRLLLSANMSFRTY